MGHELIKGDTGVSLSLVLTLVGVLATLVSCLVAYIFLKCKNGWTEADSKMEEKLNGEREKLDIKIGQRSTDIYNRIETEKNLSDEKNEVIKEKLDKEIIVTEGRLSETMRIGIESIHDKIDEIKDDLKEAKKDINETKLDIAELRGKSDDRRRSDTDVVGSN